MAKPRVEDVGAAGGGGATRMQLATLQAALSHDNASIPVLEVRRLINELA
ncbi:MAG: hypothetical protein QME60_07540 [Verrucomicrobiota bacterium]|nr:hypothetical protein [Verrucomicrobiota bacterium]